MMLCAYIYRIHHKRFIRMRRVSNKTCRFAFELEARATRKILKDHFAQGMARTSCLCLRCAQRQVVKHSSTGEKSCFCLSPSLASRKPETRRLNSKQNGLCAQYAIQYSIGLSHFNHKTDAFHSA